MISLDVPSQWAKSALSGGPSVATGFFQNVISVLYKVPISLSGGLGVGGGCFYYPLLSLLKVILILDVCLLVWLVVVPLEGEGGQEGGGIWGFIWFWGKNTNILSEGVRQGGGAKPLFSKKVKFFVGKD